MDNYDAALTRGDYARACSDSSMPLQQKVVSAAKRLKPSVSDCATALKTIITAGNINAGQLLSKTKLGAITVNGDRATIDVTASVSGRQVASQSQAVRENGQWRLAENTSSSSSKKTS